MTYEELVAAVLREFPHAYIGTDNDGQMVAYLNIWQNDDGTYDDRDENLGI